MYSYAVINGQKKKNQSKNCDSVFTIDILQVNFKFTVSGLLMVYLWVVIINEVQVDSQLPHTFKGLSELQAV